MKRKADHTSSVISRKSPKLSVLPTFVTVDEALDFLHKSFPSFAFQQPMRPVLLKSQLYALIEDRTLVDGQVALMQNNSKIRLFKLEDETDDSVAFMLAEDYIGSFTDTCSANNDDTLAVYKRFCEFSLNENRHLSVTNSKLIHQFTDREITLLVQIGALTIRSVGVWWISSPTLGRFLKTYRSGQRELLTILRRKRFKELLLSDVTSREPSKSTRLGYMFHVLAHLGAGTLVSVPTSSGDLIRLRSS